MLIWNDGNEPFPRINRYIMECKCDGCILAGILPACELIDTLWNVNLKVSYAVKERVYGINRYIMECKFVLASCSLAKISELIDTLWNVNGRDAVIKQSDHAN